MKNKLLLVALITVFFTQLSQAQWNPSHPGWTDSFEANGFCWCASTNYDHNLDRKTLRINGTDQNIVKVCDELKKHPLYRSFRNGDAPYNDIQCGNGPANDADDEDPINGCPGRTDEGPSGCDQIGPRFDMDWLSSRAIFGGDDDDDPNTDFDIVSLRADNNRYVASEDGRKSMTANRTRVGRWEKFEMISEGGNTYAFKGSNGKYVSSESGRKGMNTNRDRIGSWEKFEVLSQGGDTYALRGNNGKYVTRGSGDVLYCTADRIGTKEKFNFGSQNRSSQLGLSALESDVLEKGYGVSVYPNVVKSLDASASIKVVLSNDSNVVINIFDLTGKVVSTKNMGVLKNGTKIISFSEFKNIDDLNVGLYIINVAINDDTISKKLIIQ